MLIHLFSAVLYLDITHIYLAMLSLFFFLFSACNFAVLSLSGVSHCLPFHFSGPMQLNHVLLKPERLQCAVTKAAAATAAGWGALRWWLVWCLVWERAGLALRALRRRGGERARDRGCVMCGADRDTFWCWVSPTVHCDTFWCWVSKSPTLQLRKDKRLTRSTACVCVYVCVCVCV